MGTLQTRIQDDLFAANIGRLAQSCGCYKHANHNEKKMVADASQLRCNFYGSGSGSDVSRFAHEQKALRTKKINDTNDACLFVYKGDMHKRTALLILKTIVVVGMQIKRRKKAGIQFLSVFGFLTHVVPSRGDR